MRAKGRSPTSAIAPPASIENHAGGQSPSQISIKLLGCQQSHVLLILESFGKPEFGLEEVYAHEAKLRALHVLNRHLRPKIRQQLQVLRDMVLLDFLDQERQQLREFLLRRRQPRATPVEIVKNLRIRLIFLLRPDHLGTNFSQKRFIFGADG